MTLKIICRRPAHQAPETRALPTPPRGADAKQPGETTRRLLRIVPSSLKNRTICWQTFENLKSLFSAAELAAIVSLHLADVDLHLLQIAQSRARRDFPRVACEAQAIERIARNLGALEVAATAHLLAEACLLGDYAATYGLLSALSQAHDEAATELNNRLAHHPAMHGT